MRKLSFWYVALAVLLVGLAGLAALRLPAVEERLDWRLERLWTYLRLSVDPVQAPPSPIPVTPSPQLTTPTHLPTFTSTPTAVNTPAATATLPPSPTPLPQMVELPAPKWEKQDINNCGPASLTMYLRFYGWEGNQKDIAQVIKPLREDRNVNVEELAYFVRTRAGWLNVIYRVGGDLTLLKQLLAAGIPVMIEESFYFVEPYWPNDDLWAAHYQLLTGYDEAAQTFTGQDSFHGADQRLPYQKVDEYWQAFNRLYIIIYLPHQEETVKAILGPHWDADYNRQHALEVAQEETQQRPDNGFAWFNLGSNLTYFERYIEATEAFDRARQVGLPQRMFRYQFTPFIAYFHTGQIETLLTLTEYALKITPNSEEALLWRGWAFYRKGMVKEAIALFEQALVENPNYVDAQYALDFVRLNP